MYVLKHKRYLSIFAMACLSALAFVLLLLPTRVSAIVTCPDGTVQPGSIADQDRICADHQVPAPSGGGGAAETHQSFKDDCDADNLDKSNCKIVSRLVDFIQILSGIVGVVIIIMIIVGGIQYATARDNPQAVTAAKGRITNAIIALVAFLFMFAFLNYIVPGGVL